MEKVSRDKRENNINYQPEMHVRDVNSREIFKNDLLTSQFLRNYTNIPLLSNVMPEDIEDVSQKYQAFLGVEYEADTIKKVYIRSTDGTIEKEVYVLSLIEHKSENARELMVGIGGRGMGYLFENMEEIDIGAQKRNTAREKQRAEAERQRADEEKQRADEEKQRADEEKQRADEEKQLKIEAEERANALEEEVQRLRKLLKSQEQK